MEDYQLGIAIAEKYEDHRTAANLQQNLAMIYAGKGKLEQAASLLGRAEESLSAPGGNEELLAFIFMHKGDILLQLEQYDEAISCYTEALDLAEKIGRHTRVADLAYITGCVYQLAGHASTAVKFHNKALRFYSKNNLHGETSKVWQALSVDYDVLGNKDASFQALARGIDAFEQARSQAGLTVFRSSLQSRFSSLYDSIIYECLSRQEVELGLHYLERKKSRSLLDMLGNEKTMPKGALDKTVAQEERRLRLSIARLQDERKFKELKRAYQDYELLLQKIRAEDPAYASLIAVSPLSLTEIRQLIGPDTALLEYHTAGHPSIRPGQAEGIWNLTVFIVTREDLHAVRIIGLPDLNKPGFVPGQKVDTVYLPQQELDNLSKQVEELFEIVTGGNPWRSKRWKPILRSLATLLVDPVAPYLTDKKHLCIIPHGILHHIPFPALLSGERYLIEKYRISFAPSASVLKFSLANEKRAGKGMLVFADEISLPFARLEVEKIRQSFPDAVVITDSDVTRKRVKDLQGEYRLIHFATHAEFLDQAPLLSHLKLNAEGEQLQVREIFNLDFPSSLITLSGCETGISQLSTGQDLVGFSNAFLYAGASSLAVSLWKVDDRSTARFMGFFYQNLKNNGKAEALRLAQLQLMQDREFGKPYYWAPFILVGAWK